MARSSLPIKLIFSQSPSLRRFCSQPRLNSFDDSPSLSPPWPAGPICNLLNRGGKWDDLISSFGSIALSHPLVNDVLLNLREPPNAKKALLFFHWASTHKSFHHALSSYCLVASIVVRAGLIIDAKTLIESAVTKFSEPGSSSSSHIVTAFLSAYHAVLPGFRLFDLLVQTYSKMKMVNQGIDACNLLLDGGLSVSLKTYNALLNTASRTGPDTIAWKLFELMIERRAYPNKETIEIMIDVMCKNGMLQRMMEVFDRIHGRRHGPGVIVCGTLAYRMIEEERSERGLLLLKRLLHKNLVFDSTFFSLDVFARCHSAELQPALVAHEEMLKRGCGTNAFTYTALIGAHCRKGMLDEAMELLREMEAGGLKPYKETYSLLLEGCARMGRLEESLTFLGNMNKHSFLPDCSSFNELIGGLCEDGEAERANEIVTLLMDKGFKPNEATYCKLMDGFGKMRRAQEIVKLFYEMRQNGPNPGVMTYDSVERNLRACDQLEEAQKFMKNSPGFITPSSY